MEEYNQKEYDKDSKMYIGSIVILSIPLAILSCGIICWGYGLRSIFACLFCLILISSFATEFNIKRLELRLSTKRSKKIQ